MKKIPNQNDQALVFNILRGLKYTHTINNSTLPNFVRDLISESQRKPHLLQGIRIENMFGYICAFLKQCNFIKNEDSGDLYANTHLLPPDYRLILKTGYECFVEVKNCHKDNLAIRKDDIFKMLNYPNVSIENLKVAIYWSKWRLWTLVSIKNFNLTSKKYLITMLDAVVKNEMNLLGDKLCAVVPPIKIELLMDISKATPINNMGVGQFTVKEAQFYTGLGKVENEIEQQILNDFILFQLQQHGWNEEDHVEINNNRIAKIIFLYTPLEVPSDDFPWSSVGDLSGIITNRYNLMTVSDSKIIKLHGNYNYGLFDHLHSTERQHILYFEKS